MLRAASMPRRFLLRFGLCAVASALLSTSCLSPTLPLPPPDVETSTADPDGKHWIISGNCTPGALVIVLNDETGVGAVFEDRGETGHFFVALEAEQCDQAWVSQQHGTDSSGRNEFIVDTITPDTPQGSGACK